MKKVQLIELGILAVALVCGFQFFQEFISFFVTILFFFGTGTEGSIPRIAISSLVSITVYLLSFLLLISKSNWIATHFQKKNEVDDVVSVKIRGKELLYIILVSICLFVIIAELPGILIYLYETIKIRINTKAHYNDSMSHDLSTIDFISSCLKLLMVLIVLYYVEKLAGFFARKQKNDDALIETKK